MSLLLILALAAGDVVGEDTRSEQRESEAVLKAAEALRRAIVGRDIAGMVALVHPSGISCIDDAISRARWEAELRDPRSVTSAMFFDTRRWREKAKSVYPVLSVREFFTSGKGIRARVFDGMARTKTVIYTADDPPNVDPLIEFTFAKDTSGRWMLVPRGDCRRGLRLHARGLKPSRGTLASALRACGLCSLPAPRDLAPPRR